MGSSGRGHDGFSIVFIILRLLFSVMSVLSPQGGDPFLLLLNGKHCSWHITRNWFRTVYLISVATQDSGSGRSQNVVSLRSEREFLECHSRIEVLHGMTREERRACPMNHRVE